MTGICNRLFNYSNKLLHFRYAVLSSVSFISISKHFFSIYACKGGLASIKMASDKCIFISVVSFNLIFYKESLFE